MSAPPRRRAARNLTRGWRSVGRVNVPPRDATNPIHAPVAATGLEAGQRAEVSRRDAMAPGTLVRPRSMLAEGRATETRSPRHRRAPNSESRRGAAAAPPPTPTPPLHSFLNATRTRHPPVPDAQRRMLTTACSGRRCAPPLMLSVRTTGRSSGAIDEGTTNGRNEGSRSGRAARRRMRICCGPSK